MLSNSPCFNTVVCGLDPGEQFGHGEVDIPLVTVVSLTPDKGLGIRHRSFGGRAGGGLGGMLAPGRVRTSCWVIRVLVSKLGFPVVSGGSGGDMGWESAGLHTRPLVLSMSLCCSSSWYALVGVI